MGCFRAYKLERRYGFQVADRGLEDNHSQLNKDVIIGARFQIGIKG